MSVERLLEALNALAHGTGRPRTDDDAAELRLAKFLIETLGVYQAEHPEFTGAMIRQAVATVIKCIDATGGEMV